MDLVEGKGRKGGGAEWLNQKIADIRMRGLGTGGKKREKKMQLGNSDVDSEVFGGPHCPYSLKKGKRGSLGKMILRCGFGKKRGGGVKEEMD